MCLCTILTEVTIWYDEGAIMPNVKELSEFIEQHPAIARFFGYLCTALFLYILLAPSTIRYRQATIDGVGLGMTREQVLENWGEPLENMTSHSPNGWVYSVYQGVDFNDEGVVTLVYGKQLFYRGKRCTGESAEVARTLLGKPDEIIHGDSLGDTWVYNQGDTTLGLHVVGQVQQSITSISLRSH